MSLGRELLLVENRAEQSASRAASGALPRSSRCSRSRAMVFWSSFPLETYLPAAIITARQVDHLFRFMAATGKRALDFHRGISGLFLDRLSRQADRPSRCDRGADSRQPQARVLVDGHPGDIRYRALDRERADLVRDHARARERHRRRSDRTSVLLLIPLPADQRRGPRRDAPSAGRAGDAEP